MSNEPIDPAHLPSLVHEAVGKLHRYVNAGDPLNKEKLAELLTDGAALVFQMPGELKAEANSLTAYVDRLKDRADAAEADAAVLRGQVAELERKLADAEEQ